MPRLSVISAHTSPLEQPSTGDAGGMNVYLAAVLPELAALGWEIEVFTRGEGVRPLAPGVRVVGVPVAAGDKYALASAAPDFARAAAGADVVHSHYWVSGLAGMLTGAPHVHSMHSSALAKNARLAAGDSPEPQARIDAERAVLAAADAIVVAGASERDDLLGDYGAEPTRVSVVPPGVEALFRPGGDARANEVVLVGRLQPLKGQLLAVRALAALPAGARPVLRLVGGAAPGREAYLDEVRSAAAPLGDRVLLDGPAERAVVAERLRSARVAMVPSAAETFGLIALEAAASGTPVLARRTSGLVDAVREGVSGTLLDSDDPTVWAEALLALLGDEARRERLGRGGIEWAAAHSWAEAARRLDAVYRRVISDATG
ncbi:MULTISPECIES: glycosyltransferase [unclassified Rathayibacter]|uniref:glycosyltransferase n=1 Tax=unclassified Rathayibacter TaxID=2609250 RepID=UPI00188D6C3D|nr:MULTISPECIES: glycosyltransferase [unclassified Rathayibacter]MBF4463265.1 glycosyltransferase [Rathayibacter sp. VKM Ac-2879]MBF4504498.1 glycosyltransferase [Rathayibacter sp. VKM Ac-2878]